MKCNYICCLFEENNSFTALPELKNDSNNGQPPADTQHYKKFHITFVGHNNTFTCIHIRSISRDLVCLYSNLVCIFCPISLLLCNLLWAFITTVRRVTYEFLVSLKRLESNRLLVYDSWRLLPLEEMFGSSASKAHELLDSITTDGTFTLGDNHDVFMHVMFV